MSIAIIGLGVGGLTAALSLHATGRRDVTVLEAAREIREVGVGINFPPHAVRELTGLGLGDVRAQTGVPTKELSTMMSPKNAGDLGADVLGKISGRLSAVGA